MGYTQLDWKLLGVLSILLLAARGYAETTQPPAFNDKEDSITFIGHATTLIRISGTNLLTDPNFNDRIIVFPRSRAAGAKIADLPQIDAILISHTHRDHYDEWSLKQLPKDIPVIISKGNGKYPRELGFKDVRELDPWENTTIKGVKVTATPAKHSGNRNSPFADYPKALGFLAEGNRAVYFAGDTGFFDGFKEIGQKAKIDLALLPIGAYKPRWFMKGRHMNPEDALQATELLGAKAMIPIHWGSFRMALDGADEPRDELLKITESKNLKEKIRILENGDRYFF